MATIETITTILNDNLDIEPEAVTPEATFESLGIDSLDMAELTCTLETSTSASPRALPPSATSSPT